VETNTGNTATSTSTTATNTGTTATNVGTTNTRIGEVQVTPTQYTLLDRLKTIATNTANSGDLSTVETNTANTATNVGTTNTTLGEVQATPTANTVLDRLKSTATNTGTTASNTGTILTSTGTTATNTGTIATNTGTTATNTGTAATNLGTLITNVGEVQITPTAYTILDRLKTIATNTSGGGGVGDNVAVTNTLINQVYIRPTEFEISGEITRAANATAYVTNAIINGNGVTTLMELDFTGLGAVGSRALQINSVAVLSSYGAATVKLNPVVHLFQNATITGQTLTDTTAFNPSYAISKTDDSVIFESLYTLVGHGSGCYKILQSEMMRNCKLNADGKLFAAIIAGAAYTPASAEKISVIIKGYLL
jgi:hypothetical protein